MDLKVSKKLNLRCTCNMAFKLVLNTRNFGLDENAGNCEFVTTRTYFFFSISGRSVLEYLSMITCRKTYKEHTDQF